VAARIHRFAGFELDETRYELRRKGRVVPLHPKAFDLLAYLIAHRDRVVARDELLERVWGGTKVADTSLSKAISSARKALGDSPKAPRIVQTIPKRGYRFTARLRAETDQADVAPAAPPVAAPVPLVGRGREMKLLLAALDEAMAGQARLVLLQGEPGIGKTRTAEELARVARERGIESLIARCPEGQGAPGFWPWTQIARSFRERLGPETLESLLGAGVADVARILPEVAKARGEGEQRSGGPEARFRLFDGLTRFLLRAARAHKLVVVIDDLHRADLASLLLLRFLESQMAGAPLLVVGTYRDVEAQLDPRRAQALADLGRAGSALALPLLGLSSASVARLVELATGSSPSEAEAEHFRRHTGGNPFYLTQMIGLLAGGGRLEVPTDPARAAALLPRGLRDAIARRLLFLPEACRRMLQVACVAGHEFNPLVIARVVGAENGDVLRALAPAREARILEPVPAPNPRLRFAHALLRDALYEGLPAEARARLHLGVGEALEKLHRSELDLHLGELAHHFLASAAGGDGRAVHYAMRAGARALEQLAYEEAASYYAAALEALDLVEPDWGSAHCDVLLALARAHALSGQRSEAERACVRAAELARRLGSPERLAQAVFGLWPSLFSIDRWALGSDLSAMLDEALEGLGPSHGALRAKILARHAVDFAWRPDPAERARLSRQALAIAEEVGDPGALAWASTARFIVDWGELQRDALATADAVVNLAERSEGRRGAVLYRVLRLHALLERGAILSFDRELRLLGELAEESGLRQALDYVALFERTRALLEGRFDEVERLSARFAEAPRPVRDAVQEQAFLLQRTFSDLARGHHAEATARLEAAVSGQLGLLSAWRLILTVSRAHQDRRAEVERDFERLAAEDFAAVPRDMLWLASHALLAELAAYLGDGERAALLYARLLPWAERQVVFPFAFLPLGSTSRFLGILAATAGQLDRAAEHLESAVRAELRIGATPQLVRARLALAQVLRRRAKRRDLGRARQLESLARAAASFLGMILAVY
jgi:DNA-binding winged helix-turn-helix (wHTH) protein